ncbi:MAG TPA: hypothetical protein DCO72_02090 [Ruminococcus sp.]|nr:hypothetical protein [Ruminococcus sp.]
MKKKQYEVKLTIGQSLDGQPIRKSFYSTLSKADARQKAHQYQLEHATELLATPEPVQPTFETWAKEWLKTYKKGTVKQHTYLYSYEVNVTKYLIPHFGERKLSEIKQIDIQKYFNSVTFSKSVLRKQKLILHEIFETAVNNDLCTKNPVVNIRFHNFLEEETKRVYTNEQAQKVKEYAKLHQNYGIVILLETGIRRSELLGLQWNDIDFLNLTIRIRRAVVQTRGEIVISSPKSKSSARIFPISQEFAEYLKTIPNNGIYLLGIEETPQSPSTFAHRFTKFMKQMSKEIDVPMLSPHELRHTYGTLLRENGVDIYTIQKVLGHADINTTASLYVHNDIEVLRKKLGFS